jgi:hypothetical protein
VLIFFNIPFGFDCIECGVVDFTLIIFARKCWMPRSTRTPDLHQSLQRYYSRGYRKPNDGFKYGIELLLFVIVFSLVWLVAAVASFGCDHPCSVDCTGQGDPQPIVRDGDEVWLVSTRHLPSCGKLPTNEIFFNAQMLCGNQWIEDSVNTLVQKHSTNKNLMTVIYVHGNRTDADWARNSGINIYKQLTDQLECPNMRFVIWSWPSDPLIRPLKDFQVKADRSIAEGTYLAACLSQFDSDNRVALIGYSLGAQVVLSGLGSLPLFMDSTDLHKSNFKIALLAAATDCNWPTICDDVDAIYRAIDRMLVIHNECDPALRAYRLACYGRVTPMGTCGMKGVKSLYDQGTKVTHLDVAEVVGHEHSILGYIRSLSVRSAIVDALLKNDSALGAPITDANNAIKDPSENGVGKVVRAAHQR